MITADKDVKTKMKCRLKTWVTKEMKTTKTKTKKTKMTKKMTTKTAQQPCYGSVNPSPSNTLSEGQRRKRRQRR